MIMGFPAQKKIMASPFYGKTENDEDFTSGFSLVCCDKFKTGKTFPWIFKESQTPTLWIFVFLGSVHAQSLGSMFLLWLW